MIALLECKKFLDSKASKLSKVINRVMWVAMT